MINLCQICQRILEEEPIKGEEDLTGDAEYSTLFTLYYCLNMGCTHYKIYVKGDL